MHLRHFIKSESIFDWISMHLKIEIRHKQINRISGFGSFKAHSHCAFLLKAAKVPSYVVHSDTLS